MLLLPLALAAMATAAEPGMSGSAADLAGLARLGSPQRAAAAPGEVETAEYAVESAGRGEVVYVLPAGPRTVRALEVVPTPATSDAWRLARLRLTWDVDDPEPALAGLDLPMGLAFGRAGGLPAVESLAVGTSGGAWVNRFPMPYRTRALLRVDTRDPLEGRIRVVTTRGADADAGYLRGALWSTATGRISWPGRGHLAGVFLVTGGGPRTPGPDETGVLTVAGKPVVSFTSALGLDGQAPGNRSQTGPVRGFLVPGPEAGLAADRSAAYRWFVSDPVPLGEGFAVGPPAGGPVVTQTAVLFWYSETPGARQVGR